MMDARILITGCAGMLGEAIYPYFLQRFSDVLATDMRPTSDWCQKLDVRHHDAVERTMEHFRPDVILHLAAETNLEFCERHPDIAQATNSDATQVLANLAERAGATIVYISTAGVFDGTKDGFYTEDDRPNPIMVYGATKFQGEEHVRNGSTRHYVVRAGWMVGGGPGKDHKFVSKILDQIFAGQRTIYAVNDLFGTPTYTYDFAMNLFQLLQTKAFGTYHMVCEGAGSRYDVAVELVRACQRPEITVQPVSSDYFKEEYFAPRPRSEMMINANLNRLGINQMRSWKVALHEYLRAHYSDKITCSSNSSTASRDSS